jgi:hypothetical protein
MTDKVDRKLREVAVAEYRYRHEAEFAAGFLEEAGIPYRLQIDDAGGADLGLSMLRPSIIWVRAVDAPIARDLLALEEDRLTEPHELMVAPPTTRPSRTSDSRLTAFERVISAGLAAAILAVAPNLPPMPYRDPILVLCVLLGVLLLGTAVIGRAPGLVGELIRMLAGSAPR